MRLLVDENLSPNVARLLLLAGLDAVHVLDQGSGGTPDEEVRAAAAAGGRIIISADWPSRTRSRLRAADKLIRRGGPSPSASHAGKTDHRAPIDNDSPLHLDQTGLMGIT
ncbi:MAG: DUF5615 family PIN-like protein [Propionibacteriaceae bacterium]|jgi:uncharacterized protein with PIN domain|nr:DUF5615 family PIN-like protein [Propionibacteriaceae bacterium]